MSRGRHYFKSLLLCAFNARGKTVAFSRSKQSKDGQSFMGFSRFPKNIEPILFHGTILPAVKWKLCRSSYNKRSQIPECSRIAQSLLEYVLRKGTECISFFPWRTAILVLECAGQYSPCSSKTSGVYWLDVLCLQKFLPSQSSKFSDSATGPTGCCSL